ncbi:hypothetical protein GOP47_0029576 [Adiantum capillus-veneris]|nr:hypothetical protein GOP47_0029576 [Adiantum capillus-veneris]
MASATGDEAKLRSLLVLSSSSAEHITDVCRTAEAVLQGLHSPAQARNFFAFVLPTLLQKIFGFQEQEGALPSSLPKTSTHLPSAPSSSSQGWLSVVSSSPNDVAANALISLLSPSGVLFNSLLKLDKQNSSLRFFFPTERLPGWVQHALRGMPTSSHSPKRAQSSLHVPNLFTDRMKPIPSGASQVQLDTFEYFFFWFAYYAVCKSDGNTTKEQPNKENSALKSHRKSFPTWVASLHHHRPTLPNWAVIHTPSNERNSNASPNVDPYLQLLQLYLSHHVRVSASSRVSPSFGRWEYDRPSGNGLTCFSSRTEFLLQTFAEFWLIDEGSADAACYVPPSLQLTDAVRVFVNHMNKLNWTSPGSSASCTLTKIIQRPLYRFLWRPFQTWTAMVPIEKAFRIINIWLDFLQPWVADESMNLSSDFASTAHMFSERWQGFVSANYLFYTNLTIYFLEFALKYMHCNLEAMLQMISKVLNVLAGSAELLEYVRSVSSLLNDNNAEMSKKSNVVAAICDQLKILEDINCNWQNEGLHGPSWTKVRLFSKDGNGGEAILELLILQAEGELHTVSNAAHTNCKKALDAIKKAGSLIFTTKLEPVFPIATPVAEVKNSSHHSFQACKALPQHTWKDVKYKGDWMRRPIESTEFAWLVRLLVQFSDTINKKLDLSQECDVPALELVDQGMNGAAGNDLGLSMQGSPDTVLDFNLSKLAALLLCYVSSALSILVEFVRGRGWRLNLRFLGKKPVAVTAILLLFYMLRKLGLSVLSLL